MNRREFLRIVGQSAAIAGVGGCAGSLPGSRAGKAAPNILFCISDDQSWLHAGAYGDKVVQTPHFDRIAREGVLFTHAFCASPCCTPSRSAILTGQEIWRLEEAGVLMGTFPKKFTVFTELLAEAGYHVGYVHKGWSPGNYKVSGWEHNPAGAKKYSKRRRKPPFKGAKATDYAGNFADFLSERSAGRPFFFWYGCKEPHRSYEKGSGVRAGKRLEDVVVPDSLPDVPEVRSDICDYYLEIEWFDEHLGRMIKLLEEAGELENTLVVVTSDNGTPFPRAKANLYDLGVRMPLAVRWGSRVPAERIVDDFVSLADLAPTFLEAAQVRIPSEMTARSFLDVLVSGKSGHVDRRRDRVFTASERVTWCRPNGAGYPSRAIRTHRRLYIRNYEPDRWPAGDPDIEAWPEGVYGDINAGPTKTYMIEHKDDPEVAPLFGPAFGKRPAEELYDVEADPWQLHNLADDTAYSKDKAELAARLERYQRRTRDPRIEGKNPWDYYAYYQGDIVKRPVKVNRSSR